MVKQRKWPTEIRESALCMRKKGATYSEIRKRLLVAKSTLSEWFRDLPNTNHLYYTDRSKWMETIRELSVKVRRESKSKKNQELMMEIRRSVEGWGLLNYGEYEQSLLSMLYWAEGNKVGGRVQFTNTDPRLVYLFITLFRRCYEVDESRLRVRLYLNYYHRARKVIRFWSELLGISPKAFGKIYWKKRSKERRFRKNQTGICSVRYNNTCFLEQILGYAYAIADRIAPVAQWTERGPAEAEM